MVPRRCHDSPGHRRLCCPLRRARHPHAEGVITLELSTLSARGIEREGKTIMRRKLITLMASLIAALVVTAGVATSPALADSPHFLFATNSIDTGTGALNTAFKEAGLGTGTTSV